MGRSVNVPKLNTEYTYKPQSLRAIIAFSRYNFWKVREISQMMYRFWQEQLFYEWVDL